MLQAEIRRPKQQAISTFYAFLILLLGVASCSKQHPYHEAVGLIKQKKYAEATEVLKKVAVGDSLAARAKVAIAVC